jgi:hypothetical protein
MTELLKWWIMLVIMLSVTLTLQICAKYQILPFTNHVIPDSYAYELRVMTEREVGVFADGFTSLNSFLYSVGAYSFFIANGLALMCSIYLCNVFSIISSQSVKLARFIITFNPYLLIGAISPNKETYLILLSLIALNLLISDTPLINIFGILIAFLTMFIRPVSGMVLILTVILIPFVKLFRNPINLFLAILLTYFILNAVPSINTILTESQGDEMQFFQGSNILEFAMVLNIMNQNPILQLPAFAIKTALVLITPIFRPNPFFSTPYGLLDGGYSFMAYCLLPFNLSVLLLFFYRKKTSIKFIDKKIQILILYCLIGILTTIISSNITFRYIFPYSPIIVALFPLHSIALRNRILKYSIFLIVLTFVGTSIFLRKEFELDTISTPQFTSWF